MRTRSIKVNEWIILVPHLQSVEWLNRRGRLARQYRWQPGALPGHILWIKLREAFFDVDLLKIYEKINK